MLKTKTRIFLEDDEILGKRKTVEGDCFIDLNHVIAYYEIPPDNYYPEGATNVYFGNHDITILMNYNQFELIFESFKKEQMLKNVIFKN